MDTLNKIESLIKALEAGGYNAAPSTLVQGAALQIEDLSAVMEVVTYDDKNIKLQKSLSVESCKATLAQFDRTLAYGSWNGAAQLEGNIGQEQTGAYVRAVVPMAYYSHTRRVTVVANMVATVDGKKAEDREAANAAKLIAGSIEFDLFRGRADFSNAGVFDGNPLSMPLMPNMLGLDPQIRESDYQRNTQDLMFSEYGSDQTVVITAGGVLTQANIEDAAVRSAMNMGNADKLWLDPVTLASYNKIAFGKERIILAGSPQDSTGADLRKQWTSSGVIDLEASRFLSGKTSPAGRSLNAGAPSAPTIAGASVTVAGVVTSFLLGEVYIYYATAGNEVAESVASASTTETVLVDGDVIDITITPSGTGTSRYFNVYRTPAGGALSTAKYIGRVANSGAATTVFRDLNNKVPGFVTGFLVQNDCMEIKELAPYSRIKLAVTDLTQPEGHFRFCALAVMQPRKMALVDNLQ